VGHDATQTLQNFHLRGCLREVVRCQSLERRTEFRKRAKKCGGVGAVGFDENIEVLGCTRLACSETA
jgi:hypothetical protein